MIPPAIYPYDYWDRQRQAELARQAAEAQKALEAQRQRELESILQAQTQTRTMILNQAFVSTPPPSKNLPSQKVLKAIESLQDFLKQKPLFTTAQTRLAVEC